MNDKINQRGIYLLDEPEAALSPSKQLSLLYFNKEHLRRNLSQFIVATHSPYADGISGGNDLPNFR